MSLTGNWDPKFLSAGDPKDGQEIRFNERKVAIQA